MLEDVVAEIIAFRDRRNWKQYHSPRNLCASIAIEAAELLELFQWARDDEIAEVAARRRQAIREELADVLIYALTLAHDLGIDVEEAIRAKVEKNAEKYPPPR